jgi:hypothetical protein
MWEGPAAGLQSGLRACRGAWRTAIGQEPSDLRRAVISSRPAAAGLTKACRAVRTNVPIAAQPCTVMT